VLSSCPIFLAKGLIAVIAVTLTGLVISAWIDLPCLGDSSITMTQGNDVARGGDSQGIVGLGDLTEIRGDGVINPLKERILDDAHTIVHRRQVAGDLLLRRLVIQLEQDSCTRLILNNEHDSLVTVGRRQLVEENL